MSHANRRSFLKRAGAFALVTILNPAKWVFAGGPGAKSPTWASLLEYARWSPTVHNLQPHKLKVHSDTEAVLYYDPSRLLPVGDPHGVFATVALGVFMENLSVAAAPHGRTVEVVELFGPVKMGGTSLQAFARLRIASATRMEPLNRELILSRRTSRKGYDGKVLADSTLEAVRREASSYNHDFLSSSDEQLIDQIVRLNQDTLMEDISSAPMRQELNGLFRYSKEEAAKKADGLWSRCMGFPGAFMRSVFQNHEYWSSGFRKPSVQKLYKSTFKGTATIGWFSGPFSTSEELLQAGRMMARTWLQITKDGAYIQPFGSLITNEGGYRRINELLTHPTGSDKKIWMLFRTGYSPEPARSYRLPVDQILIS
jgi:hypothetical protein